MHKTNVTLTNSLHAVVQAIADQRSQSVAAEIERLLWNSREVQAVAKSLGVTQEQRIGRGKRGKGRKTLESE